MSKEFIVILITILLAATSFWYWHGDIGAPVADDLSLEIENKSETENTENDELPTVSVIAENLSVPWDMAFLPQGGILITERTGNLVYIDEVGTKTAIEITNVAVRGEGGLLGVALHPEFEQNNWLYLYKTTSASNVVERYSFVDDILSDRIMIIDGIPAASNHNGGAIAFGPDGALYVTTGDAGNPSAAQDLNSLAGKILRLDENGNVPLDNPFNTAVWSYGHRNPQGLTWDDRGRLWSTEHGRSGLLSGLDELNLIGRGANYGWPIIQGDETHPQMSSPMVHSGSRDTWAPAAAAYLDYGNASIFFGGLRGQALYEAIYDDRQGIVEVREHFKNEYGRIRAVTLGPDGALYISTSNTDGRGSAQTGDDKIIRIDIDFFRLSS